MSKTCGQMPRMELMIEIGLVYNNTDTILERPNKSHASGNNNGDI
jgi:hypothetical protein